MRTHTTVSVLGEEWDVNIKAANDELRLTGGGFCDDTVRELCVKALSQKELEEPDTVKNYAARQRHCAAHEIVHAFLFESGLSADSWADNEEIVDWIGHNIKRMAKALEQVEQGLDFQEGSKTQ